MYICIYVYMYIWIYENMVDENYSRFAKTGPNKGIYQPMSPKNTEKREREREREKKD